MFQFGHFVINQYLKLHLSIKHPQSYSVQGANRIKVNQYLPVHWFLWKYVCIPQSSKIFKTINYLVQYDAGTARFTSHLQDSIPAGQ